MSRVIIGPYKQGLNPKNVLDEHKGNGLPTPQTQFDWPEAKRPWPRGAVIVLATDNELKVIDNILPLANYDIRVVPKGLLFGSEDSVEVEENAIEIARKKVEIGLETPWGHLTDNEKSEALRAIGVSDQSLVLWMAEDREMKMDPALRCHKMWSQYAKLPLIREAFCENHLFPGKRLNELMNAVGGAISLLDMFTKVANDLGMKDSKVFMQHTSYVTYYIKPVVSGVFPLPDEGIYIVASEKGRVFRPVVRRDRDMEAEGSHYELDHFDVPEEYVGYVDRNNRPVHTVDSLRSDPGSEYFKRNFVSARAIRTLIECAGIPKLDKPRGNACFNKPDARIISNLNIGHWAQPMEGQMIADYSRSSYCSQINSHADLEKAFYTAEAAIVEPYPQDPPENLRPAAMSAARYKTLYNLIRRLECQMFMENRLALKPLSEPTAYGRPFMIHQDLRQKNMLWYFDAAKFRTVTTRSEFIFSGYEDEEDLFEKLRFGWEEEKFAPNPEMIPPYNLLSRQQLLSALGLETLGFAYASFGSASSHIPSGNNDCYAFSSLASMNGVNMLHGGGGRYIMEKNMRRLLIFGIREIKTLSILACVFLLPRVRKALTHHCWLNTV